MLRHNSTKSSHLWWVQKWKNYAFEKEVNLNQEHGQKLLGLQKSLDYDTS